MPMPAPRRCYYSDDDANITVRPPRRLNNADFRCRRLIRHDADDACAPQTPPGVALKSASEVMIDTGGELR